MSLRQRLIDLKVGQISKQFTSTEYETLHSTASKLKRNELLKDRRYNIKLSNGKVTVERTK